MEEKNKEKIMCFEQKIRKINVMVVNYSFCNRYKVLERLQVQSICCFIISCCNIRRQDFEMMEAERM